MSGSEPESASRLEDFQPDRLIRISGYGAGQALNFHSTKIKIPIPDQGVAAAAAFAESKIPRPAQFDVDMTSYPTIARIHAACAALDAFARAEPQNQPDAE